ncbi:MAG: DNA mismatch repair endonuclease MutL [Selenomonadaceae bacterium]|nr:DNA mismatch repair endonuclease MutL [Selenomonadaceae bacterium]
MSSAIHLLSDSTINKIAAGEVVERPASVVKELVENAIDAGATRIEVEIMAGGTSFMRVTDNGRGMTMEDARLAIQRHATSKITEASDLQTVSTLGFRGEALPTIASVSRFTLLTRRDGEDLGTRVQMTGGKDLVIEEAGTSVGTTVQVEDLFFNTPARKKFLKTNHTETNKISDFLGKLALSRPDIAFRLISNNRQTIVTPGQGDARETIRAIYGSKVEEALLPLEFVGEEIAVEGFITKPSMLRGSRAWQTLIVNGRVIGCRAIQKAIDNAYRSLIPKSGYPFAVIGIQVPQRTIDVNVHPQKAEMKFEDESSVFRAVYKAVRDAIRAEAGQGLDAIAAAVERPKMKQPQPSIEPFTFHPAARPAQSASASRTGSGYVPQTIYEAVHGGTGLSGTAAVHFEEAQRRIREEKGMRSAENQIPYAGAADSKEQEATSAARQAESMPKSGSADGAAHEGQTPLGTGSLIPIGQVARTYIIAQDEHGLYIIDQHAAHERILFDRFSAEAEHIASQQLLVHLVLSFDARETALLNEHKELFARLGFAMEMSGDNEFRLMEIPADLQPGEAEDAIREILAGLFERHETSAQEIRQACLATTACRAAIKAGEELSLRQMQLLLEALAATAYPFTCPHGRPTILKFSDQDLAKMFQRTGFHFQGGSA